MEEGGVEEHRKDGESLLLKESRTLLGVAGIVSVLRPVTLSPDVHWDDVSELSVAVTQHGDMLRLTFRLFLNQTFIKFQEVLSVRNQFVIVDLVFALLTLLCQGFAMLRHRQLLVDAAEKTVQMNTFTDFD